MHSPEHIAAAIVQERGGHGAEAFANIIAAIEADRADREPTVLFASTTQGDLEVELYRSSSHLEAEVHREFKDGRPSELVLKERLDLTPMLQAWVKDLLDRAQKTATD